jgi:hypothetical protein
MRQAALQKRRNTKTRKRQSRPRQRRTGRALIEIALLPSQQIQVSVLRSCDNPIVLDLVEFTLSQLRAHSPNVNVRHFLTPKRKRGGPIGTPEAQKLRIARGWLKVQGRMNQEAFARGEGISPATLRRWLRELDDGKL